MRPLLDGSGPPPKTNFGKEQRRLAALSDRIAAMNTTETQVPAVADLSLAELREANIKRNAEWDPEGKLSLSFRGNELAGEIGEACNVIKKIERERLGLRGSRASLPMLAEELADGVICIDLAAMQAGVDLSAAIIAKFNASSAKNGLSVMLGATRPAAPAEPVGVKVNPSLEEILADATGSDDPIYGEGVVVLYDPRGDEYARREPHKIIDASIAFMEGAECGDRLYSTAEVRRILSAAFVEQLEVAISPPPPLVDEIERILDEQSAWIARPNREVSSRVAMAAACTALRVMGAWKEEENNLRDADFIPDPDANGRNAGDLTELTRDRMKQSSTGGAPDDLVARVADALEAAKLDFDMTLIRLVDGESTYRLTYSDGLTLEFSDTDELYAHVAGRKRETQARAALEAAHQQDATTIEGLRREIERLKDRLGDPDGTLAHANAIIAKADAAEARATAAEAKMAGMEAALREYHNAYSDYRFAPEGSWEARDASGRLECAHDVAKAALTPASTPAAPEMGEVDGL